MTDAEYRREKRAVAVPFFFKRKIFMVFMMLVCSGIMAVAATYAWFILSTAPEVVGVSTTVGANGSLEIALLNNETGINTSLIKADVGDSISIVGAKEGNVTWGNLVDLSDASYGLNTIVMYPSVINATNGVLDTNAMLSIPHNGVDGRITRVSSNTAPAVYKGSSFTTGDANYGVRAIGSVGGGSGRGAYLAAAKSSFQASKTSAVGAAQNAISANGSALVSVAMNGSSGVYNYDQVIALQSMAAGLKNSLNYILTSYKQAIIANAAANAGLSDNDFETIRAGVTAASGNALSNYASQYPAGISAAELNTLSNAIANADIAVDVANNLLYTDYGTENETPVSNTTTFTYAQISGIIAKLADTSTISLDNISGATLTLSASSGAGLITNVADYVGNYSALAGSITISVTTANNGGAGLLQSVSLDDLTAPSGSSTTSTNSTTVTNFYGYVVDLAFRTNVAAELQLQSAAIDRIYTDGAGATAGSGSNVTYTFTAGMTNAQIVSLFSAIRVVFFDPDTGTLYGTAKLDTPSVGDTAAKANLYMIRDDGSVSGDEASIATMEVAVPKKVSALVYLDGTELSNISVINAENSGTMLLNLQFSSSADLKPMIDNELKNATAN